MSGSGAIRSPRTRRGQVMIVGNGIEPPHGQRWPHTPRHADNIFDALGELTAASPSDPIATIAITSDHLRRSENDPQLAIDALRRVDPSVRIVLLASARDESHGIGFDGFDETLHWPLRAEDVALLFDEDAPAIAPPVPPPAPTQASVPGSAATPRPASAVNEKPRLAAAEKSPAFQPHEASSRRGANGGPTRLQPTSDSSTTLGDIDLVDAVLGSPDGVQAVALSLMAQQTGWNDIQFLSTTHGAIDDVSIVVARAGTNFGTLTCASATPQQLQPWADWLAHWLALDQSHRTNRMLAFQDDLTGAWNRRFFNAFLHDAINRAAKVRRPVTVMVFDLDNFKSYNDEFGHAAGDDILRETVRLMNAVVRQGDRVCRIGGDEFAVIFADPEGPRKPGSTHPDSVEVIATRFQDKVCSMSFPKLGVEAPGTLSISAGLATYPWDGHDPDALLRHADELTLESKRKGKNAITFGPGAQRECGKQQ